jgi:hypothetical protein
VAYTSEGCDIDGVEAGNMGTARKSMIGASERRAIRGRPEVTMPLTG